MTGYARAQGGEAAWSWTWEARGVNGRGLELRLRLPNGLDHLEPQIRAMASKVLVRGNCTFNLGVTAEAAASGWRINQAVLDQVIDAARTLAKRIDAAPPRIDGLLALKGVIETGEGLAPDDATRAAREARILSSFAELLEAFVQARRREGDALMGALVGHLDEIAALTGEAAANAATRPEAIRRRLDGQIADLLGGSPAMNPDRLAQEAALLATRADIREEIDRLVAHVGQARALLAESGAIGRKLDFLTQEFNREANTLCSKSSDLALTRTGLALKAAIDRLREQAANIE